MNMNVFFLYSQVSACYSTQIDSIYKFPVVSQSRACQELAERAKKLQTMADSPLIVHVRYPLVSLTISHLWAKMSMDTDI